MNHRGYFGIAIYHPKITANVGTLWRSAHLLGADFLATIGHRYRRQASDTMYSGKHIPMFQYNTFADFKKHLPWNCKLIGIELSDRSVPLDSFSHPERAVYLLGAEDYGLPEHVLSECHSVIQLRGEHSMNVSVAGSIVMYHRTMEKIA